MITRSIVVAIGATACACASAELNGSEHDPEAIEPGAFCFTLDGVETCSPPETQQLTQTVTDGNRWFRVTARVAAGEIEIFGQIPDGATLPRDAEEVVVTVPVRGTCTAARLVSPFSPACAPSEIETVCPARVLYDPSSARVTVLRLEPDATALDFIASVSVALPDDCCPADLDCETPSAAFAPSEPLVLAGTADVDRNP